MSVFVVVVLPTLPLQLLLYKVTMYYLKFTLPCLLLYYLSFLILYLQLSLSLTISEILPDPKLQRCIADLQSQRRKNKKKISCPTKTYFIFGRILLDGHLEIRLATLYDLKPFIQAPDLPIVLVSRPMMTRHAVCYLV